VRQDMAAAKQWFEKAAAQNLTNAAFMLGLFHQRSNAALSEQYFQRAKTAVWASQSEEMMPAVVSIGVSEHFSKWHYVNFHQRISNGFRDGGRRPGAREVIEIRELNPDLQRCVMEAQKLLEKIPSVFYPLSIPLASSSHSCVLLRIWLLQRTI
jgi:TPR repeat protein